MRAALAAEKGGALEEDRSGNRKSAGFGLAFAVSAVFWVIAAVALYWLLSG
jgi:hypothetical protein